MDISFASLGTYVIEKDDIRYVEAGLFGSNVQQQAGTASGQRFCSWEFCTLHIPLVVAVTWSFIFIRKGHPDVGILENSS